MQFWKFRDVKIGVKDYFESLDVSGKTVVDAPAGEGRMSSFLSGLGADVKALDLFTHGAADGGIEIVRADLTRPLPISTDSVDCILCQEGIEHLTDQVSCLKEFNMVLKEHEVLIITAPNYSNLRAKFYTFFTESRSIRHLPANEVDDVRSGKDGNVYFGHVFLIGIQKLRLLASVAGFRIKNIHPTKVSGTSLVLFFLLYPVIFLLNIVAFYRSYNREREQAWNDKAARLDVFREILRINLNLFVLLSDHLFVEFEKHPAIGSDSNERLQMPLT